MTAVQEFEGGIMLCCDVSHKVLRTQTAYDLIKDVLAQKLPDTRAAITKALLGAVVLTRYNNKCYRSVTLPLHRVPFTNLLLLSELMTLTGR